MDPKFVAQGEGRESKPTHVSQHNNVCITLSGAVFMSSGISISITCLPVELCVKFISRLLLTYMLLCLPKEDPALPQFTVLLGKL